MQCGAIVNVGSAEAPDVQQCVHDWPHPDVDHETEDGETWTEDDPRVVGF